MTPQQGFEKVLFYLVRSKRTEFAVPATGQIYASNIAWQSTRQQMQFQSSKCTTGV